MLRKFKNADGWTKLVVLFMWGTPFLLGKMGAYAGLAMGPFFVLDPRVFLTRWYKALTRHEPLSGFAWALLISFIYGIGEVIYGIESGYSTTTALQILVFNICPLYLFLGLWAGIRWPGLVRSYIRFCAWYAVIYAPLYFLFLSKLGNGTDGDSDQFSRPGSGSIVLIGLLSFEPNLGRFWLPIVVLSLGTIASQMRADWLSLGLALVIWGVATKKLGRVFGFAGLVFALLLIGFVADVRLPGLPGRGGELSARDTVARAAASVSEQAAEDLGSSRQNAQMYAGTVYWRTHWWAKIREEVSQSYQSMIFGLGYGYPINKLGGHDISNSEIRSPHNIFYFVLAYSGLIGVALFFWMQVCIFRLLWQNFKATDQIYGFAYYAWAFIGAFFGNFLETPQGGIPTYIIVGLCLGPLFRQLSMPAEPRLVTADTELQWVPENEVTRIS